MQMNSIEGYIRLFLSSVLPSPEEADPEEDLSTTSQNFSVRNSHPYSHVSAALAFIICSFISKENAVMFDHLSCNFSSGSSSITVPGPLLQWCLYSNQRKPKRAQLGSFLHSS